ncbi:MAG: DUF4372 domain-containing protein [Deltaproteobacteria bacterium]|nr:DUF4372 domain-containing protein [Deltaproteobacteria bacterium]
MLLKFIPRHVFDKLDREHGTGRSARNFTRWHQCVHNEQLFPRYVHWKFWTPEEIQPCVFLLILKKPLNQITGRAWV